MTPPLSIIAQIEATVPWWVKMILPIVLSALVAGASTYFHNDRDLVQRVSVLESHRQDDSQHLDRIESKLDKLVDWTRGK